MISRTGKPDPDVVRGTLIDGTHRRWEGSKATGRHVDYVRGDVIPDLRPEEIANLGKRIQVIGYAPEALEDPTPPDVTIVGGAVAEPEPVIDEPAPVPVEPEPASAAVSVTDWSGLLSEISSAVIEVVRDLDSRADLQSILASERAGKARKAVIRAIESRLQEAT